MSAAPRMRGFGRFAKRETAVLAMTATVLLAWEAADWIFQIPPETLPSPVRIAGEIWLESGRLRTNAAITAYEIFGGLFLALLFTMPFCLIEGRTPLAERVLKPFLASMQRAPVVLLAPLFFIWLGYGIRAKLLISALLCLIVITRSVLTGLQELPQSLMDLTRIAAAPRRKVLVMVLLPASLPPLLAGIRTGAMTSLVGCIIAEYVEAEKGLGSVIVSATSQMDTPLLCAAFAVLIAMAAVIHLSVGLMEGLLIPWQSKQQIP